MREFADLRIAITGTGCAGLSIAAPTNYDSALDDGKDKVCTGDLSERD